MEIKKKRIVNVEDVMNRKPIPGLHVVLWRPLILPSGDKVWVKTGNLNAQQKEYYLNKGFKEKLPKDALTVEEYEKRKKKNAHKS